MLSICGNSFKPVGKAFQIKLVERMPSVYKAVIKAKGGYFEELFYNVENSQNKEKPWNEKVCWNF